MVRAHRHMRPRLTGVIQHPPVNVELHAQAKNLLGLRAAPARRSCAACLAGPRAARVRSPTRAALESVQLEPLRALPRLGQRPFPATL